MVDVDEALSWLNEESGTRLTQATQDRINNFYAAGLSPAQRRNTILALLRTAASLPDPFEQAEVYTNSGVHFYRMMQMNEAIRWIQRADDFYRFLGDAHREACTSWILFRVMRSSGQYSKAFYVGRRSRRLFQEKALQYHQLQDAKKESRYIAHQVALTVDLISTPEDSYEWLLELNGTRMSRSATQIKKQAEEHIERRMFDDADRDLKILEEITSRSRECAETGEALAYCGVAEWVMEHQMNALYYFRSALTQYVPYPHEYAFMTWILGLAELSFPDLRAKSMVKLESAIQKVEELRQNAIWKNDPHMRDWYVMHGVAMRRVLTHVVE